MSLAGVCRKGRSSPVPQVRARPEEMRCVGSKRTRELGRDMLLAASIVKFSVAKAHMGEIALCRANLPRSPFLERRVLQVGVFGGSGEHTV